MDLSSLFTTPEEDIDLSLLRMEINRTYRTAFKQLRKMVNDRAETHRIIDVVEDTIREVDLLIQKHNNKHHPVSQMGQGRRAIDPTKEPF